MAGKQKKTNKQDSPILELNRNYSIPLGAKVAGCSAITFWRAIYAGHLETYRIGRRRTVSGAQILAWLEAGGKTSRAGQGLAIAV
ncbi:MAG: hypothetical protein JST85_22925 [Acidobacteria bacterium]|nr:hypothetical protein [Acidobacteriota bacterium]